MKTQGFDIENLEIGEEAPLRRLVMYAARVCARLGGWTGYYGKPGPVIMLQGWLEFQAAKRGAALLAGETDL